MKATDLRIGNWVSIFLGVGEDGPEYKNARIKTLDTKRFAIESDIVDLCSFDVFDYDNALPIPLTPEILEKAGIKYSHDHNDTGQIQYWGNGHFFVEVYNGLISLR